MKRNLEVAIRENITAPQVEAIIQSMIAEALNGNVSAGKLIIDKVLSNAVSEVDEGENNREISIKISNLTPQHLKDVEGETIDHEDS